MEKEAAAPVENALEHQGRALVQLALAEVQGNQSVAAKTLHIGRDALRYQMKKYNLLYLSAQKLRHLAQHHRPMLANCHANPPN